MDTRGGAYKTIKMNGGLLLTGIYKISKQSRTVESEDVQNFLHAKERGIDVELFVRKNKDDNFIIVKGQDSDPSDCRHAACLFILHNNILYDTIIC